MTNLEKLINEAQSFLDYAHGNDGCGDDHATRAEEVKRSTTRMLIMIKELVEKLERTERRLNVFVDSEAEKEILINSESFKKDFFENADYIFKKSVHENRPIQSIEYQTVVEYAKLIMQENIRLKQQLEGGE